MRISNSWIRGLLGKKVENPLKQWQEEARVADRLEGMVSTGSLDVLWDEILAPMDQEAYEAFQKMDPSDFNAVAQAQKVSQVVADIRKRVERKIELGRFARQKIQEFTEET